MLSAGVRVGRGDELDDAAGTPRAETVQPATHSLARGATMRRVGQSRRRDGNEREIVDALCKAGVWVWRMNEKGLPDLLTFQASRDRWLPIEVKRHRSKRVQRNDRAATLTPAQRETYAMTTFPIVETVAEALALFGVHAGAQP